MTAKQRWVLGSTSLASVMVALDALVVSTAAEHDPAARSGRAPRRQSRTGPIGTRRAHDEPELDAPDGPGSPGRPAARGRGVPPRPTDSAPDAPEPHHRPNPALPHREPPEAPACRRALDTRPNATTKHQPPEGRSAAEKPAIALSIQSALVSTLEVPDADRYQLFNHYDAENFRQTSSDGRRGVVAADDVSVTITEIGRANVSFGLSSRRKRTSAPGTKPGIRGKAFCFAEVTCQRDRSAPLEHAVIRRRSTGGHAL